MNVNISDADSSIHYYDSDYPSQELGPYPENFDEITKFQGLAFDVARYKELAQTYGDPILELCCGTGRVAIPLAQSGFRVVAVDASSGMLKQFRAKLEREGSDISARLQLVEQDITELSLSERSFPLAVLAFNSLLCVTDFEGQCRALQAVAEHLTLGGILVLDVINPLSLNPQGEPLPAPFFTRRSATSGAVYTRFAMMGAFDENQRQRLHGWYDEVDAEGIVRRQFYSLYWRPVFRFELELMLKKAGFTIISLEGGHQKEPYTAQSPRMFIQARKT